MLLFMNRSVRETFIRAKYVQHAFVHPHPNFERPEIPVPLPSIPDLLTPSKSLLSLSMGSSSPHSPQRRSFSPSIKLKSPRSLTGSLRLPYRPSSTSSSINPSNRSTPVDSEDDIPRSDLAATVDPSSSSLHILAENLKKLEKSGKVKNLGDKLGDKFKSARKSSKKFTGYALSKLGAQGGTFLRRGKRSSKSKDDAREVHSDTEEGDDLTTSSTPLLHSMSASTHNLTISSVPPPKPPRTFKTKFLGQAAMQCSVGDEREDEDISKESVEDDFSTDVLNALRKVSLVMGECSVDEDENEGQLSKSDTKVIVNGCLPSVSCSKSEEDHPVVKRSESSPLLSHSGISSQDDELETSSPDLQKSSHSMGLQPIAEAKSETLEATDGERLVSSVPLRRKVCAPLPTSSLSQSYMAVDDKAAEDVDLREFLDDSVLADKRLSMMSTTSADFYSAASSEANSTTASPDLLRRGVLSPPTPPSSSTLTDSNRLRVTSSTSVEEEYFSTPPSSPNPVDQADKMTASTPPSSPNPVDQADKTAASSPPSSPNPVDQADKMVAVETRGDDMVDATTESSAVKAEDGQVDHSTPARKDGRKRSLTTSESMPLSVKKGRTSSGMIQTMSKDDNFQTEYHRLFKSKDDCTDSSVLATSFSTQDLADILGGGKSVLPALAIEPVKEEPSTLEEEVEKGETVSSADRSISPACSSPGGSMSPEIIEPIVIPDEITPDMVRVVIHGIAGGNQNAKKQLYFIVLSSFSSCTTV